MNESTESTEQAGGFDRRSMIKKGMVVGGAAVALPIITTFDAPAFAASGGGNPIANTRFQFHIDLDVSVNTGGFTLVALTGVHEQTPGASSCSAIQSVWAGAANGAPHTVKVNGGLLGLLTNNHISFRIPANKPCVFVTGARGNCSEVVLPTDSGKRIKFNLGLLSIQIDGQDIYLLANCVSP